MKKNFQWNTPRWSMSGYMQGEYRENNYYILVLIPLWDDKKAYVGFCQYKCKEITGERRKYVINKMKRYLNQRYGVKYGIWKKDL